MDEKAVSRGLGAAGKRLVHEMFGAMTDVNRTPDARQADAIRAAAKLRDRSARLEKVLDRDGEIVVSPGGIARPHPALVQQRQTELAIARLLGVLNLKYRFR